MQLENRLKGAFISFYINSSVIVSQPLELRPIVFFKVGNPMVWGKSTPVYHTADINEDSH